MDVGNIPWDKPLSVVLAIALLGIIIDIAYRKIPRGFAKLRVEIRHQTERLTTKSDDDKELLQSIATSIERLDTAIAALLERFEETDKDRGRRRPRSKKKSTGPAVRHNREPGRRPAR